MKPKIPDKSVQTCIIHRRYEEDKGKSRVRKQLEEWIHWLPLACAVAGMYLIESDLAFLPWKVLGLMLAGGSGLYVVRILWHTDKEEKNK